MKLKSILNRVGGCSAALVLTSAIPTAHAAIAVDGSRNTLDETDYTERAVQATATNWGPSNSIANLHTAQAGSDLAVFVGGRVWGNSIILFIDSKTGGNSFIPNNLIVSGGDEAAINRCGTSPTSGLTFETGFNPDYAIRIFGNGNEAHVNLYNFQTGHRTYVGQTMGATVPASGFISEISTVWTDLAGPAGAVTEGVEMKLNLAGLGIPIGAGQPVKLMALLFNDTQEPIPGSINYGSNQVLASRTSTTDDIGTAINSINFETEADIQTISLTVDNTDTDGDGLNNEVDPDDDNDGLLDTVETNSGIYISPTDTGSNPLIKDTDADSYFDGDEVTGSALGYVSNPNIDNYVSVAAPGSYTTPQWQPDGSAGNAMTQGDTSSLTAQYEWTLNYKMTLLGGIGYKFAANGSWATYNWGNGPNDIAAVIPATGFHTFSVNNGTEVHSLVRTVFANVSDYLTAYEILAGDDSDSDGVLNQDEFTANTDPTNSDTDGDGVTDDLDSSPLLAIRDVVFSVNMSIQESLGNFNPANGVVVKFFSGLFAGHADLELTEVGNTGVYTGTLPSLAGTMDAYSGDYKFFHSTPGAPNSGYELDPARYFLLGMGHATQTLDSVYFSNISTLSGYDSWSGVSGYNLAPNDGRAADPDNDGHSNFQEFLFGTVPNAATGSLVTSTPGTGAIVLTWLQRNSGASYSLLENSDLGTWLPSSTVPTSGDQAGVPANYTRMQATIPTSAATKKFLRVEGVE